MFIVVTHAVHNPPEFWGAAQKNLPLLPEAGVKRVLSVLPNRNMDLCICIWEADSIEVLDKYLRSKVGDTSSDTFYELNESDAIGFIK